MRSRLKHNAVKARRILIFLHINVGGFGKRDASTARRT
jgi:hypothetical protein